MTRSGGFTLAELAVALVIIALLLAGAIIPLSTQVEVRNISDTQRAMEQIKESIVGFALANGRLPCPARGETPAGTVDTVTWPLAQISAGAEQYDTTNTRCYTVFGVVPWSTLGVPETDAWGRRFTYRVSPAFADAPSLNTWQSRQNAVPVTFTSQNTTTILSPGDQDPTCPSSSPPAVAPYTLSPAPTLSSFALCTLGDIAVFTRNETTKAQVAIGAGLPAVIISHGKNGYGAFQPSGRRVIGANDVSPVNGVPDQNLDESSNVDGTTTGFPYAGSYRHAAFYSRDRASETSTCHDTTVDGSPLCEFDDIVVMLSSSILIARMVSAGRLP